VSTGATREGSLRYRLSRALETHVLRRADAVTTICEGLQSERWRACRGGSHRRDTEPGRSGETLDPRRGCRGRARSICVTGSPVIGSSDPTSPGGLDVLLEALPQSWRRSQVCSAVRRRRASTTVLRAIVKRLALESRVIFAGRCP